MAARHASDPATEFTRVNGTEPGCIILCRKTALLPSDPLIRRHKIMSNFFRHEKFSFHFHFHFQVDNFEEYK